ncbi:MAG: type VI secretion system tube protein Hcp [Aquincola sp.]|nr:type VI secretion system tube protein Hcp [Aquincola sp.]
MARSDMFLKATAQRSGVLAGESNDKNFPGQIDIVDWSWGMSAPSTTGGQRTGRVSLDELKIVKRVDKASTALMATLNTNDVLSSVVLTVRKSGSVAQSLVYFVMTLQMARITSYQVSSTDDADGSPVLMEHIGLSFKSITIDYTPQSSTGGATGTSSFTGQAGPE